MQRLEV